MWIDIKAISHCAIGKLKLIKCCVCEFSHWNMLLRREMHKCYNFTSRLFSFKRRSLLRTLILILLLSLVSSLFFLYRVMDSSLHLPKANPPIPHIRCHVAPTDMNPETYTPLNHKVDEHIKLAHRALLITEMPNSKNGQKIRYFLNSLRIEVKFESKLKPIPTLTNKKSGRFAVVVFENFNSYLELDSWNKQLLDKYCHEYHVGIIGFVKPLENDVDSFKTVTDYHITFQYNLELEDYKLNPESSLWHIMRPREVWKGFLPDRWTVFHSNHSTYQPLAFSKLSPHLLEPHTGDSRDLKPLSYATAVLDLGEVDGISKVLFGYDLNFWLNSVIMMDALSYLSYGKLDLKLERYIQIDVDDIFVGKEGIRMKVADVEVIFHFFLHNCKLASCTK